MLHLSPKKRLPYLITPQVMHILGGPRGGHGRGLGGMGGVAAVGDVGDVKQQHRLHLWTRKMTEKRSGVNIRQRSQDVGINEETER